MAYVKISEINEEYNSVTMSGDTAYVVGLPGVIGVFPYVGGDPVEISVSIGSDGSVNVRGLSSDITDIIVLSITEGSVSYPIVGGCIITNISGSFEVTVGGVQSAISDAMLTYINISGDSRFFDRIWKPIYSGLFCNGTPETYTYGIDFTVYNLQTSTSQPEQLNSSDYGVDQIYVSDGKCTLSLYKTTYNEPVICDSLDALRSNIGVGPYTLSAENEVKYGAVSSTTYDKFDAGFMDTGYSYAYSLLSNGISVIYDCLVPKLATGDTDLESNVIQKVYDYMSSGAFYTVSSTLDYDVKFITSGGYPTYGYNNNSICSSMLSVAANRGDCVAIIDHAEYDMSGTTPKLIDSTDIFDAINRDGSGIDNSQATYGTMFTPWYTYSTPIGTQDMPASYGYLMTYAAMVKNYPSWYAVAGLSRGGVVGALTAKSARTLTNSIAETINDDTKRAINPITPIRSYGNVIWGNKTLLTNESLKATMFLSQRIMISDIKKTLLSAARSLLFDQDTEVLWASFRSMVTPLLDRMSTGNGLSGYTITRTTSKKKNTVSALVTIYTIYDVEGFDITVSINPTDSEASVS